MVDIATLALDFIDKYGLIAIFILLVLDGAMLLPVFPGEVVLIIAVATTVTDTSDLIFLVGLASAAALVGSLILYGVTRGGGRRLVEKYPSFFMMPRKRRERLERVFSNWFGQTLVMWMRIIPLTRILVSIPAGLARMPLLRFIILSTIGLVAYHAAFLYFTFETQREDSALAAQADQLKQTYATPAWGFVEANSILTGIVVVLLGAIISIRASSSMIRDPEESTGSLIGNLATAILLYGGIVVAVMLYLDPESIYGLMALGGLEIDALAAAANMDPVPLLALIAGTSIFIGFVARTLQGKARQRKKSFRRAQRIKAKWDKEAGIRQALSGEQETGFIVARTVDITATPRAPEDHEFERADERDDRTGH